MKRFLSFICLLILTVMANAKNVLPKDAAAKAEQYLEWRTGKDLTVKSITSWDYTNSFYIVNFAPSGWVIVSGDDVVTPIIGYNVTGSLVKEDMPENMRGMMTGYSLEVQAITRQVYASDYRWSKSYTFTKQPTRGMQSAEIAPLIKVNWDQPKPYNKYCPKSGDAQALVGCVAVGMCQAMSVQQWPDRPQGKVTYGAVGYGTLSVNYDEERAYNWSDIMSGANNKDEVARFLYHAGVSVKMEYGEDGSGVPSNVAPTRIMNALIDNFKYDSKSIRYYWRDQYSGNWEQMLVNELAANRAIVYCGNDNNGGHCFNLDGYDGEGYFHVNWGWSGSGNGNFKLSHLSVSGYNFQYNHTCVVGIGAGDRPLKSIEIPTTTIEENLPAGSVVSQVLVNGEAPKSTYKLSVLCPKLETTPFKIEGGLLKTTQVLNSAEMATYDLDITVESPEEKAKLTQGYTIEVTPWQSVEHATSMSFDRKTRILHIKTKHNVSLTLSDASGKELEKKSLEPLPETDIDFASLNEGKYILKLQCADDSKSMVIVNK
ncbi:MAG: thiol protease/hemagglutinin PrtT [Bacteroidaceae bacterium]|nr:thiol protease/hemagglutinin PrtT [Bacteroidaceae bacterium]